VRQVLKTTDRSLVESLLIALHAEGIDALANESGLPFIPASVSVVDDAEFERALAALQGLQARSPESVRPASWFRRTWRFALLVLLVAVLVLCIDRLG
jgi:hypothetical protein